MANLLSIGKSGLLAAQVGLATTGHNIANANVVGYNRQVVIQQAGAAQSFGSGFVGSGTEVAQVTRIYDNFLASQVRSAQSSTSSLNAYAAQIVQVDNMLADSAAGLSPALQDFFKGVQDVSANPALAASRQALLSSGESLAARFQSISGRLNDIGDAVNGQIEANVNAINSYAQQIAKLNEAIGNLGASNNGPPNDLLDQRDLLVSELNKYAKATVVNGSNNSLTVSIGTGQPLVVGQQAFQLAVNPSVSEPGRQAISYVSGTGSKVLPDSTFSGGELGGLLEFRSGALERVQSDLGRVAIGLASAVNAQHKLGVDLAGNPGGDFFKVAPAYVAKNGGNVGNTAVSAVVSDVSKLVNSDYSMKYEAAAGAVPAKFVVTRLSDGARTDIDPAASKTTIDGVDFTVASGSIPAMAGDSYVIKPTLNGASGFGVALLDRNAVAAAAPLTASALPASNTGSGKISELSVNRDFLGSAAVTAPLTLTYDKATNSLSLSPSSGLPSALVVKVNGVAMSPPYSSTNPIPFTAGNKLSFGGVDMVLTGTPGDQDSYTIAKNVDGVGDSRNAALLAGLQTKNVLGGGTTTFQGAYSELVSFVGNKTREVQINGAASASLLTQVERAQQDVSGVNLDEEAANLLRYQQAYQAAGKAMQIASTLFDVLLSLGR
jgi:flagellar hook-associated protein 1 FlgK